MFLISEEEAPKYMHLILSMALRRYCVYSSRMKTGVYS